jgi:hypothetical protein
LLLRSLLLPLFLLLLPRPLAVTAAKGSRGSTIDSESQIPSIKLSTERTSPAAFHARRFSRQFTS